METEWTNSAIEQATIFLSKWRGGKVKLWDYTPTHCKLTFRVEARHIPGNLHIVCGGCSYIRGLLSWRDSEFQVKRHLGEDGVMVLSDEVAGFELHCRIVSVEENVEPVYMPNLGISSRKE